MEMVPEKNKKTKYTIFLQAKTNDCGPLNSTFLNVTSDWHSDWRVMVMCETDAGVTSD